MTAKKPAGKAKSAVDGKYVTPATAKDNPRETVVETVNPKYVVLKLADLQLLRRAVVVYGAVAASVLPVAVERVEDEIDRAIAAFKGE